MVKSKSRDNKMGTVLEKLDSWFFLVFERSQNRVYFEVPRSQQLVIANFKLSRFEHFFFLKKKSLKSG